MKKNNLKDFEQNSSAVTLSDMEIFVFPELMYSLVLANIMSPRLWKWRDDPRLEGLMKKSPSARIKKLKQYIMDNYVFNLDLNTWGLTFQERELDRFKDFIPPEKISESNALFGYHGDRYYFDVNIREHFGLDTYDQGIIPYWKTETIEAMDAFKYKDDYKTGAGECVSLSALYAAALFVVARIPLNKIYMMATPLHSQNYVDTGDGILTNNRRLVTKNMWFNGTALSAQARRALENERVTIVTHESGYIHTIYKDATISPKSYEYFRNKLNKYLKADFSKEIFGNFLRAEREFQSCFQLRRKIHGSDYYLPLERVFEYEHGSTYKINDSSRERLLALIEREEYHHCPYEKRIVLNDIEDFISTKNINLEKEEDRNLLVSSISINCPKRERLIESLIKFCHVKPRLPDRQEKTFTDYDEPLSIGVKMTREEIIERIKKIRGDNRMAQLAFYAYRDLLVTEPGPFLHAALNRNPVSIKGTEKLSESDLIKKIESIPGESIYDGKGRLAQPDEVWNYHRGDGAEKAILLANILISRGKKVLSMKIFEDGKTVVFTDDKSHGFSSQKRLKPGKWDLSSI